MYEQICVSCVSNVPGRRYFLRPWQLQMLLLDVLQWLARRTPELRRHTVMLDYSLGGRVVGMTVKGAGIIRLSPWITDVRDLINALLHEAGHVVNFTDEDSGVCQCGTVVHCGHWASHTDRLRGLLALARVTSLPARLQRLLGAEDWRRFLMTSRLCCPEALQVSLLLLYIYIYIFFSLSLPVSGTTSPCVIILKSLFLFLPSQLLSTLATAFC